MPRVPYCAGVLCFKFALLQISLHQLCQQRKYYDMHSLQQLILAHSWVTCTIQLHNTC